MNKPGPIVVVHEDHEHSMPTLRLGMERSEASGCDLVVVHRAPIAISVIDGPSPKIADQLGNPMWSQVHAWAMAAGVDPSRTTTVVGSNRVAELIKSHAPDASVVLLGSKTRSFLSRLDLKYRLEKRLDCPVVRVHNHPAPARVPTVLQLPVDRRRDLVGAA